jgi:hypothetical protein
MEAAVKMALARKKRLGALVMLSRMRISSDILRDQRTHGRPSRKLPQSIQRSALTGPSRLFHALLHLS